MSRPSRSGRVVPPRLGHRHLVAVTALVLIGTVPARIALAQEAESDAALSKSQLIRLVTSSTYTQAELVEIVGRSCLSFEPTARDIEDLSSLGAETALLDAVRACASEGTATEAGEIQVSDRSVVGQVEGTVTISVTLQGDGAPVAGRRLILRGTGDIVGGGGSEVSATTDDAGRATFTIQTGTASLVYPLSVTAAEGQLSGDPDLELMVLPGPAARADFSPARLELQAGADASRVEATIRDRFSNPIVGATVALALPTTAGGTTLPGTTDSRGVAHFAVVTEELRVGDRLVLSSGGTAIGELEVVRPAALAAGDAADTVAIAEAADGGPPADAGAAAAGGAAAGPGAAGAGGRAGVPVDTLLAEGGRAASDRDYSRAQILYRQVLDVEPDNVAAHKGLGEVSMALGLPENAMLWYQAAVSSEPDNVELWLGLGRARSEAGYQELADEAFQQVLRLDPNNTEAQQLMAGLNPQTPLLKGVLWGGNTFDNGRSFGIRAAELVVWPLPSLSIWGRYDNTLALYEWALVRGRDDFEGLYGGLGLEWGPRHTLSTRFEAGRREPPGDTGLYQTFYHLEQGLRVGSGLGAVRVNAGGYLGRWYDRDDWQIYAEAEIPAGAVLTFVPALYFGETVGTAFVEVGRIPADEFRGYLTLDYRPVRVVRLQPSFGLGSVSSEDASLDGTLVDALFQATVGTGVARGELFLRYQDAPGVESFTVVAIGVTLDVPRGGF